MQDYPRVTEVIKAAGMMGDTSWYTEEARDRGTAVHKACWYLAENDLDLTTLDPRVAPRVAQFQEWLQQTRVEIHECEKAVKDDVHVYRGTADILAYVSDCLSIIDIKCGPPQPWHGVQTAAYANAIGGARRFNLYLTDTDYKFIESTDRDDWKAFVGALSTFHWRARHGV